MRKFAVILLVAAMVMVSANFGFADVSVDVRNDNANNASATGGNATQNQKQEQQQKQKQQQKQSTDVKGVSGNQNVTAPVNLPEVGFSSFPNPGKVMPSGGWEIYSPCVYSEITVDKIGRMKETSFFWSDIDIKAFEKIKPTRNSVLLTQYWPKDTFVPGDEVLGEGNHPGKAEKSDGRFIAKIEEACYNKTGSTRVAIRTKTTVEGVTDSATLSVSGAAAATAGLGQQGAVLAVGGGFGRNRTSAEERTKFEFLCMNDNKHIVFAGERNICSASSVSQTVSVKTIIVTPPAPAAICSPEEIQRIYISLEENRIAIYGDGWKKKGCDLYSLNNLRLRAERGDLFYRLYKCTGDKEALYKAIENYEIAARNYRFGHDIKKHQVEADRIIAHVYEGWAIAKEEVLP